MRLSTKILAGLLVLLLAGPLLANFMWEAYKTLPTKPTDYRTVTSGAEDALDPTTVVDAQLTNGCPTVAAQFLFSIAGSTATVECHLYDSANAWQGVSYIGTATASTSRNLVSSAFFHHGLIYADTATAHKYDWRVTDVSAGTCTLRSWTVGGSPLPAK